MKVAAPLHRLRTRAVRIGVYLPLGALSRLRAELGGLNRARVERLVDDLIDRGAEQLGTLGAEDRPRGADLSSGPRARTSMSRASSGAFESARVTIPDDPKHLPVDSYESLGAEEVRDRLEGLTQTDLARIYGYERAHQDRSAVVSAIEARIVDLPIPAYDSLTAAEILRRLNALDADELEQLRAYEGGTKKRSTVISRIESLLK